MADNKKKRSVLSSLGDWFDERLGHREAIEHVAAHPVPKNTASWWYVFGSGTMVAFMLQLVTGICLALVYTSSAENAYISLEYLNYHQPLGWYLRAVHYWGSNLMIAILSAHVIQVFLFGAYKFPRELTWVIGVLLLLLTLGMAFTGQVVRFDQNAYWGLGIGVSIIGRIPVIGAQMAEILMGGPIIGAATLSRFYALHVFVIPGLLIALIGVHLILVFRLGINEWPMPGRLLKRDTYKAEYEELIATKGTSFFPTVIAKDVIFGAIVIFAVMVCAAIYGPGELDGVPDPTLINTMPVPDFYFLPLFAMFALLPPSWETFLILGLPPVAILIFILLPFLTPAGEKSFMRRPMSVIMVILVVLVLFVLAIEGKESPWSPKMDAWSSDPTPVKYVKGLTPLELQGAVVVQAKQCRNCHAMGGLGGVRGPALDGVASRMTQDQLIRQVIQGGGNMPAYGKQLKPAEVSAVIAFMRTLHTIEDPQANPTQTFPKNP